MTQSIEIEEAGNVPLSDDYRLIYADMFSVIKLPNDMRLILLRGVLNDFSMKEDKKLRIGFKQEVIGEVVFPIGVAKSLHKILGDMIKISEKKEKEASK